MASSKKSTANQNLTPEQVLLKCARSFEYFCVNFVFVEDKETHKPIPFRPYNCQKRVGRQLVAGLWLWILKARRLGLTWLLAAYSVWLVTVKPDRKIAVMAQDKEYASDFIDRCRFIYDRLPGEMQQQLGKDNICRLQFLTTGGEIRALAPTRKAARSLAADLVIFDEAALIESEQKKMLRLARQSAQPTVETGKGQIVAISTSQGPRGDFYDTYQDAPDNGYTPVFIRWDEHPKRDLAWYQAEQKKNAGDPLYMKREYPASPEEAFEQATGRVYTLFTKCDAIIRPLELQPDWRLYRAIDFGGVDPFVCLWGAVVPGDGAALTVDPSCKNFIREMLAYSYGEDGQPLDVDNHCPDALRYMVTSPPVDGIRGHLHIYRELYTPRSASMGLTLGDLAGRIKTQSGSEKFEKTYCDRSRPDNINELCKANIPSEGQRHMRGDRGGEIEQGILRVNELVVGTVNAKAKQIPGHKFPKLPAGLAKRGAFG